ncbi:MAG: helix-hairpin-helix domain-containing protein [Bacteroidota bacterium]|nr:helix-hairpin-helix domain-containing protein [Bacteroidota bacterium]
MKRVIKDYFTFSRKERAAVFILLLLIVFFIALPYLFEIKKTKPIVDEELQLQLKKSHQKSLPNDSINNSVDESLILTEKKVELFEFDPNILDVDGWKRLGIPDKTIKTILNYRSKGGKFYKPEDIRKIWGLQKNDADRIIPFAKINAVINPSQKKFFSQNSASTIKNIEVLDINTASADQLMQIPGIGHSLPYRIINYREKLGAFFEMNQLRQTWGMTDSIYQLIIPFFKIESATIRKININTATDYELSKNPHISREIAKAIVMYRNQHGLFQKVEDIKKIVFINEEIYLKISPFLATQ